MYGRGVQVGFFKSSHDQVKSGQNLVKSSSEARLNTPTGVQASFFSNQVKSQVKSRGRICFKSSHDQVKSGQNFCQVIKSSHQVKRLEHPYPSPISHRERHANTVIGLGVSLRIFMASFSLSSLSRQICRGNYPVHFTAHF